MIYSARQFRASMREVLDQAMNEPVIISRDGQLYQLKAITAKEMVQSETPKIVEKIPEPVEVTYNLKLGKACCIMRKPCQHWQYNPEDGVWVNSLTGDRREINE